MRRALAAIVLTSTALLLAACCGPSRCDTRCSPCSPCGPAGGAHVLSLAAPAPGQPAVIGVGGAPIAGAVPGAGVPINATCPVLLGNPIDPNITTLYKGRVVGFCGAPCKAKFEKNPEKYEKNLP